MRTLKISLIITSCLLAILYIFSFISPYIHPQKFWPITFIALAFPVLLAGVLIVFVSLLFFNTRWSLLVLLLLLLGYNNITRLIAFNIPQHFSVENKSASLRIMSWNVKGFGNNSKQSESPQSIRRQMIHYIKSLNADILLLQEFSEYKNEAVYSNTKMLSDSLGYKYYYTSKDDILDVSYGPIEMGSAIFSKTPLSDTVKMIYQNLTKPESAIRASIAFNNRKVSLITTHLLSMNLKNVADEYDEDSLFNPDKEFNKSASKFAKLKHYDKVHSNQAIELKAFANSSPYPIILSGDFNATPNSFTYQKIKGNLKDPFLEKGWGLGRTYSRLSPTLRIDYILAGKEFEIVQYHCPQLQLSDHYPLITDVEWR